MCWQELIDGFPRTLRRAGNAAQARRALEQRLIELLESRCCSAALGGAGGEARLTQWAEAGWRKRKEGSIFRGQRYFRRAAGWRNSRDALQMNVKETNDGLRGGKKKSGRKRGRRLGSLAASGLYTMPGLVDTREIRGEDAVRGSRSDGIVIGTLEGKRVGFGATRRGIAFCDVEINFRANILRDEAALSRAHYLQLKRVGSLQGGSRPGEFFDADQFVESNQEIACPRFFGGGLVAHVTI